MTERRPRGGGAAREREVAEGKARGVANLAGTWPGGRRCLSSQAADPSRSLGRGPRAAPAPPPPSPPQPLPRAAFAWGRGSSGAKSASRPESSWLRVAGRARARRFRSICRGSGGGDGDAYRGGARLAWLLARLACHRPRQPSKMSGSEREGSGGVNVEELRRSRSLSRQRGL